MVVANVHSRSGLAKFVFVSVFAAVGLASCSVDSSEQPDSEESQVNPSVVPFQESMMSSYGFDSITPTGQKLFAASLDWLKGAEKEADSYMVPYGCAKNVSRVMRNVGIRSYSSPLVDEIGKAILREGGKIVRLPKATKIEKIESGMPHLFRSARAHGMVFSLQQRAAS